MPILYFSPIHNFLLKNVKHQASLLVFIFSYYNLLKKGSKDEEGKTLFIRSLRKIKKTLDFRSEHGLFH